MIVLRDYQERLIADARAAMQHHSRVLVQLPTGGGKTAVGAFMAHGVAQRKKRIMFLTHRIELLKQTSAAFEKQGLEHDTIQAGKGFNPYHSAYVGAIQTVANRMERIPQIDLLIVDECHHAVSESWAKTITAINPRWTIGLSATPCRLDGRGLGEQFDVLVKGPSTADLIEAGHLSPYRIFAPASCDLGGVKTIAGDFNKRQLGDAFDRPTITGNAVAHYRELALGKRAVVFCVSIAHAEHVRDAFLAAGIAAASVDGKMLDHDRARVLAAFEAGSIQVLTSCDLVSEGFDLPAIEVAISLRPTKSLSLWLQQIGRALRLCQGKTEALILDHASNYVRHGLPDDEIEWSLHGKVKKKGDDGEKVMPIRQCKSCFHVHRPAASCPACGTVYEIKAREPEQVEGNLVQIDRAAAKKAAEIQRQMAKREISSARTRDDLERIASERGYKPGWVNHILSSRGSRAA